MEYGIHESLYGGGWIDSVIRGDTGMEEWLHETWNMEYMNHYTEVDGLTV